jgi:hypothetical protein
MGTGGPFPGGKEQPGLDADHSPAHETQIQNATLLTVKTDGTYSYRSALNS